MTIQRKQFGRRGLTPEVGQRWSQTTAAAAAPAAYAAPGYGVQAYEDNDSFSILKVFSFFLGTFFSFYGRVGRMEYWTIGFVRWFFDLIVLAVMLRSAWPALEALALGGDQLSDAEAQMALLSAIYGSTTGYVCTAFILLSTISYWSLLVRRQHDRDVSGFWLLMLFIPIFGGFYGIYLFFALGFFAGSPGPNRFDTARSQAHVFD